MQCTLLIPRLFRPRAAGDEAYAGFALPELQKLLAHARRQTFPAIGMAAWLCQAFEVERQRDWPVAPLTLELDGEEPGAAYWLRADPVHLHAHRGQLLLADCGASAPARAEADALIAALNRHFAADGLRFHAPHPGRWYLRLEADPEITTHALAEAAGDDVDTHLPAGKNALRWHRIGNEIQMLLHDHPVNEARAARGEPAINSVWLWGGGKKPAVPGRHFSAVWSGDALALALAADADLHAGPLPDDAQHWLRTAGAGARGDGHHLLVLDQLERAACRLDPAAWRDELTALNRKWFAPMLAALRRRRIARLAVVVPGTDGCGRFELAPRDLLRFWRRTRPLASYAPAAEP